MKKILPFANPLVALLLLLVTGCNTSHDDSEDTLFKELSSETTGIDFRNEISYTSELNPYTYRNFFNGGGVAMADFNKDGLLDIFFSGNQVGNRLYVNQGNLRFKDITAQAGVSSPNVWSTGVSVADINGDGWLDIYVCKSGSPQGENRHNELFINNGDLTFTDQAEEWGIDVTGLSTDATFFDYDRDGDLDMYLLNNSFEPVTSTSMRTSSRTRPDPTGGDKLFRNELVGTDSQKGTSKFVDVTAEAGIYSSAIGFGLDLLVGDINKDGWPDIYISNDYFERDYLYLNNKDGTFSERLPEATNAISLSSMGGDLADVTGDGRPEIYVTDMLPESLERQKRTTAFDFWDDYIEKVNSGYHHQFVRNTLQFNRGLMSVNGSQESRNIRFSEIGRMAKVDATDWSWSALIADLDLDSSSDIFVTNGIFKDLTNQDYVNNNRSLEKLRSVVEGELEVQELFEEIPSTPLSNYAFQNISQFKFENKAEQWGLASPGFSNGAAYGDLDNDGDLDLAINNINADATVYENQSDTLFTDRNWLKLKLSGGRYNSSGIGSQVMLWGAGKMIYREQMPNRGYQSTVSPVLHFGLGNILTIDSLKILWPDGRDTIVVKPGVNKLLKIKKNSAEPAPGTHVEKEQDHTSFVKKHRTRLKNITDLVDIDYRHQENTFTDFNREKLLFHMLSTQGPAACKADINNDGLDDLFIGGAKGQAGGIYVQQSGLKFSRQAGNALKIDQQSEDTDCNWFDADGDGDLDLYVASGGSEFPASSSAIADRLYINGNGGKSWKKAVQALPSDMINSTSTVQAADFDGDGDQDIFTASRLRPFAYGSAVEGKLLVNDGKGKFSDATKELLPELESLGPITDSRWFDFDGDGDLDLIIAGEWMPIRIFENQMAENKKAVFREMTQQLRLDSSNGWWQAVEIADLNNDGYPDIIAGNQGLNSMFRASEEKPMVMQVGDFDQNGIIEQLIARTHEKEQVPMVLRQDLLSQIPSLRQRFPTFKSYAPVTVDELLEGLATEQPIQRKMYMLESSIFWNRKGRLFERQKMPPKAQFSPIYGTLVEDQKTLNSTFLYVGGNLHAVKPQVGRYDASYGSTIQVKESEELVIQPHDISGFTVEGEVRSILQLKSETGPLYLVIRNNDTPIWFERTHN